ncbi:class I SAM-dependent methyltransferase [Bryobacter aggregatus]|uniref:class I SAM-dependent methyltransferase n=1 Tax=Bryobacter aggregatus TaxID=360054 RepID=UPI00068E08AA|nr:class I SAM-dependent methyltransferase [Bryobacter aggregatus]
MAEFTGERVIPGKVDIDLWNEHLSRYLFASRLARGKRVIDLGCGAGYGSAELAANAASVIGVDVDPEAVTEARKNYVRPNLQFDVASLEALPFADGIFELGVCFEVIEHLTDYRKLLSEVRRVLAPGGQFIVSTPNIKFYAESRKRNGPNPFHEHEFEFEEFRSALSEYFPHQAFFVQNHASGLVFLPIEGKSGTELRLEASTPNPDEAHFFVAVCASTPMIGGPSYVYVPTAANVLREREHHIERLEAELQTKNEWLAQTTEKHQLLVDQFRNLKTEIEAKNQWALEQNARVDQASKEIERLESEMDQHKQEALSIISGYEAEIAKHVNWSRENESKLNAQLASIAAHVQKLDEELRQAHAQIDSAEARAMAEQTKRQEAEAKLAAVEASRWIRMGKAFGLGPKFS